ncbi:hypothetical protein [Acidianus sp. HS-5]|uniref:hypothetical protein n=1 Tax=Acidianus sp. HS-5 TaxID=2886040 RepID=UPI001F46F659|nr:hypothetical protein [Acidianus sp. HS-5]BDC17792.1 hypothetical protein HS5_06820 [Acidianus sp. HS-5]
MMHLAIDEGKEIMTEEYRHFLEDKQNKQLYLTVMEIVKLDNEWKDIKSGVEINLAKLMIKN